MRSVAASGSRAYRCGRLPCSRAASCAVRSARRSRVRACRGSTSVRSQRPWSRRRPRSARGSLEVAMNVWIDGELFDGETGRIPVRDHGLLYGDGIFEGIRVCSGRPFRFETHLSRLADGARPVSRPVAGGEARLRQAVTEAIEAYAAEEGYIRLIVTRGDGPLGVDPTTCERARVICIVDRIQLYPEEKRVLGLSMITS